MIDNILPRGSRRRKYFATLWLRINRKIAHDVYCAEYGIFRKKYHTMLTLPEASETIKFSIIVPCYNTPNRYLLSLINSIFAQSYNNWELILVDGSSEKEPANLIQAQSNRDNRIKTIKIDNGGIAANTNVGIKIATGDFICFLDHDDLLDPYALSENAKVIKQYSPDLVYSDEDKINEDGSAYLLPHYKPDFSIDLLRNVNYICHFVVVKIDMANKIGGLRIGFDGAQDYDFLLRLIDNTKNIVHIPKVLYHWRQAEGSTAADFSNKKEVLKAGIKALDEHYQRNNIKAKAYAIKNMPGFYGAKYKLSNKKRAVVICLDEVVPQIMLGYVQDKYKKLIGNMDVRLLTIKSMTELKNIKCDDVLIIRDLIIPTKKDDSLNAIFGLLDSGAKYVAPQIISMGKIYDNGYIEVNNGSYMSLFRGVDPTMPMCFGSTMWNRNVNGVNSKIFGTSLKSIDNSLTDVLLGKEDDRIIALGAYQYILFGDLDKFNDDPSKKTDYFNSSLSYNFIPKIDKKELLIDYIEADQ